MRLHYAYSSFIVCSRPGSRMPQAAPVRGTSPPCADAGPAQGITPIVLAGGARPLVPRPGSLHNTRGQIRKSVGAGPCACPRPRCLPWSQPAAQSTCRGRPLCLPPGPDACPGLAGPVPGSGHGGTCGGAPAGYGHGACPQRAWDAARCSRASLEAMVTRNAGVERPYLRQRSARYSRIAYQKSAGGLALSPGWASKRASSGCGTRRHTGASKTRGTAVSATPSSS
jgi:hypothetical protein